MGNFGYEWGWAHTAVDFLNAGNTLNPLLALYPSENGTGWTGGGGNGAFNLVNVPEPSTLVLAAVGLVGVSAWGWRRKR